MMKITFCSIFVLNLRQRSCFYDSASDALYLTMSRCACDDCLLRNFRSCTKITHHLLTFNMKDITLNRIMPYPEPCLIDKTVEKPSEPTKPKKLIERTPKDRSRDNHEPAPVPTSKTEVSKPTIGVPKSKNQSTLNSEINSIDKDLKSFRLEIETKAKTYVETFEILPQSTDKLQLVCQISENESLNAKNEMRRLNCIDQEPGFYKRNEYYLSDVDRLLNMMKLGFITANGQPHDPSIDIMLCQAFNNLINIRLKNPFQSIESFNNEIDQMFPNGLINDKTNILITGLYSSTGQGSSINIRLIDA